MTPDRPQQQDRPGWTAPMQPQPRDEMADYVGRGLLDGRTALITGGDSGMGRAVADRTDIRLPHPRRKAGLS